MSYPQPPEIATSYSAAEQALGDGTLPGQELDVDLAAVRASITATIEFLKGITRSDGKLANGIVTQESLSSALLIGFDAPEIWATGVDYTTSSTVFQGYGFYLCTSAHTSGVFATDLASSRWSLLADLTPPGGALIASSNLSDLADTATARTNLGLGTMATASASAYRTNVEQDLAFQPLAANLTAEAGLTGAADRVSYFTGAGAKALATLTGFGRSLIDDADAATARATLGLGTADTVNFGVINITGNIISDAPGSVEWQLDKGVSGNSARIWGETGGLGRWVMDLGDNTAESGSNAGSNFTIKRYDDAGVFLADAFAIRRNTGACLIYGEITMVNNGKIAWNNNISINVGTGTPEGAVTAPVGSLFLRTDGGAGTSLYVKQTGTGNTGWVGK